MSTQPSLDSISPTPYSDSNGLWSSYSEPSDAGSSDSGLSDSDSSDSGPDDDESGSDYHLEQDKPRAKKPAKIEPARQKATIHTLAIDENITSREPFAPALSPILERIRKCIARSQHPGTLEPEAKAALHMASRLMTQYNISQGEAYAKEGSEHGSTEKQGGQSVVRIEATGIGKKVICQGFTHDLATAICKFFDCKSYRTTRLWSVDQVFYGIAPNTVAAASSFEMVHNLILEWMKAKKGVSAKHSYAMGVSAGLVAIAKKEKRKEEKNAKEQEEAETAARIAEEDAQRQREIDRLGMQPSVREPPSNHIIDLTSYNPPASDSDSDTEEPGLGVNAAPLPSFHNELQDSHFDDLDPTLDLDDELKRILDQQFNSQQRTPTPSPPPHTRTPEPTPTSTWSSPTQLARFRGHANKIAEDYLKEKDVKLGAGRKRQLARDNEAWKEGKRDSRKIDVKRRRIEE
ncbi:MAG: hypothetical protein M1839_006132 [Geoglossum umbratile]|nr:MAG: hypothetical protein M1839_006132 [Geoglossum umbratile]